MYIRQHLRSIRGKGDIGARREAASLYIKGVGTTKGDLYCLCSADVKSGACREGVEAIFVGEFF